VIPVRPRPAASVLLVRAGTAAPLEVYMIRRQRSMRFLGGYYAFPGGKVDEHDASAGIFARCRGISARDAERLIPSDDGAPALAYWVSAAREVLEETGVLFACDADGHPVATRDPAVAARVETIREALAAGGEPFEALLEREKWWLDLGRFRYLSHFITPPANPIRYTARFFLAPLPAGQGSRLLGSEASEGFWIAPADGYRGFREGVMPMAEPADCGLAYLAQFDDLEAVWAASVDGRPKFHGILDRVQAAGIDIDAPPAGRGS